MMNLYERNSNSTVMDDRQSGPMAEACRVLMADVLAPMDKSVVAGVMRCVHALEERRRRTRSLWLSFAPAFVTAAVLVVYAGALVPSFGMRSAFTGSASIPRVADSALPPDDSAFVTKGAEFSGGILTTTQQALPLLRIELGGSAVGRGMVAGFFNRDYPEAAATLAESTLGDEVLVSVDAGTLQRLRIFARVYGLRATTGANLWLPVANTPLAYERCSGDTTGTAGLNVSVVP